MRFVLEGHRSAPGAAWELVADTDYLNRVGGNGAMVDLRIEDLDGAPMVAGATVGPGGMRIPFVETHTAWVQERSFRQDRRYDSRLLTHSSYRAVLEPDADGVRPVVTLELEPATVFSRPLLAQSHRTIRARWQRLLAALPRPGSRWPDEALRPLPDPAAAALERWRGTAEGPVVERVEALFRHGRPLELQRMRPFALADRWHLDREETLVAMLKGVESGALELFWSLRCVRCHGEVGATRSLAELADEAQCASCRIASTTDLGRNVEVLFAPHPSVALRVEESFCTLFPAGAPDQVAMFTLTPGASAMADVPLAEGVYRIGVGGGADDSELHVGLNGRADRFAWSPRAVAAAHDVRSGVVVAELANDAPTAIRVGLTRRDPHDDRVPASYLTTLPDFRSRMAHQVLAPDHRIAVREVTLLFSDLTDSTAMYEQLGDAGAFAVVRDHFALLRDVVESHGGVIVKTIGDAIMAAYHEPARAVACALAMQARFDPWIAVRELDRPPRLKIGLHTGPALVVHSPANGLDYFGRTVNLAARAQGVAAGGEIVWTEATHGAPEVARALSSRSVVADPIDVELKGLGGATRLVRVRPIRRRPPHPTLPLTGPRK